VRILEDPREVPLGERLAVPGEERTGLRAHTLGGHGRITARHRRDRTPHEVERLVARQAQPLGADGRIDDRGLRGGLRRPRGGRCIRRRGLGRRGLPRRLRCLTGPLAIAVTPATTAAAAPTTTPTLTLFSRLARGGTLSALRRSRARLRRRRPDLELPVLELHHVEEPLLGRLEAEARELRHPEVLLVERRVDLDHHLLQAVGAHHVAVALHPPNGLGDELPRIPLLLLRLVTRLHETGERVVGVVLVAVLDEEIARRLPDADADDVLPVLLELEHERREVGVAGEQDEGPDLRTREDELHRIDGKPDVSRVLLRAAVGRCEDEVDRRLGERNDVLRVTAPVGVGALHGHLARDDGAAEEVAELRLQIGADPHRDVVEVDEERRVGRVRMAGGLGLGAPMDGSHHDAPGARRVMRTM